jgi:hypothetical protein
MPNRARRKTSQPVAIAVSPVIGPKRREGVTKLQTIVELLSRADGADLGALTTATGWQAHAIRGAIAGQLKKKGLRVESEKIDGRRVYRLARTAEA